MGHVWTCGFDENSPALRFELEKAVLLVMRCSYSLLLLLSEFVCCLWFFTCTVNAVYRWCGKGGGARAE